MTTLLDTPPRTPVAAPPVSVRVTEERLPAHEPLALYTALRELVGPDKVYLLESPVADKATTAWAVVGTGRIAQLTVTGDRLALSGASVVTSAVHAAADRLGMALRPDGSRALGGREDLWRLLDLLPALFDLDTDRPAHSYTFGFLTTAGYGTAWHVEDLPARAPGAGGADLVLTLFQDTVWYDLDTGEALALRATGPGLAPLQEGDPLHTALRRLRPTPPVPAAPPARSVHDSSEEAAFVAAAERCLEHIRVGDIYQIQIGHRIEVNSALAPLDVYRRLRARNPSPYMFLVPRDGGSVIGASPEMLLHTEGDRIVMRPIAGTAPRSGDPEVDGPRVARLRASEKERAEHVMLVDLCRNDIGRVARTGTLRAEQLMDVEEFSHVFHLVSTVEGRLAPGETAWTALRATFPAGTVTGAPKIRAMEIIQELEREPRGMYAGAVGLVDLRGWSRLALCIRTVVHDGDRYATRSCAGIVADSDPRAEWRETLHKMGAAYWAMTGEELLS